MSISGHNDYEAALAEAKKRQRILFLYFHKSPG